MRERSGTRSGWAGVFVGAALLAAGCRPPHHTPGDAGLPDTEDAGAPDAGEPDAVEPDAGEPDAGEPDAGVAGCMPRQPSLTLRGSGGGMTYRMLRLSGTASPGALTHVYASPDCTGPEVPQVLRADATGFFTYEFGVGMRNDGLWVHAVRSARVEDEQGRLSACEVAYYVNEYQPTVSPVPPRAPAVRLTDMRVGTQADWSMPFTSGEGLLYFIAPLPAGSGSGSGLWRSDGTREGTFVVAPFVTAPEVTATATAAGRFYFILSGTSLWTSDGTAEGTTRLLSLAAPESLGWMGAAGERVVFLVRDSGRDVALWTSDGSEAGTLRVTALANVAGQTPTTPLQEGAVLFAADDGVSGSEPWRTDGTAAGTARVADVAEGAAGSSPGEWHRMGSRVFFSADDGLTGRELWVTDGTPAGTRQFLDLKPGAAGSGPGQLTNVGGTLFFSAGGGLFRSDGTREGTQSLGAYAPREMTAVGGSLFFMTGAGTYRRLMYLTEVSAGPAALEFPVFDHIIGRGQLALTSADNTLLFYAFDYLEGEGWWQFDGTHVPTRQTQRHLRIGTVSYYQPLWAARTGEFTVLTSREQLYSLWTADIADTTPPELVCPGEATVTVEEPCTPVSYPAVTVRDAVSTPRVIYTPAPGSPLPYGVTKVTVTAYDRAGNGSTCSFPLRVR